MWGWPRRTGGETEARGSAIAPVQCSRTHWGQLQPVPAALHAVAAPAPQQQRGLWCTHRATLSLRGKAGMAAQDRAPAPPQAPASQLGCQSQRRKGAGRAPWEEGWHRLGSCAWAPAPEERALSPQAWGEGPAACPWEEEHGRGGG